jgi:hypothetical protein
LAVIFFLANVARAQTTAPAWRDHLTRQDVITALGEPNSDGAVGNNELLMYKGGLVIQLQNGEVSDISGTVPEALKPAPAPAAAAPAATTPPALADSTVNFVAKPAPPAATPSPAASSASTPLTDEQDSEKIINDFSTKSIVLPGTPLSGVITKAFGTGNGGVGDAGTASIIPKSMAGLMGGADNSSPWSQPNTIQGFMAGLLLKTIAMTLVLKGAFAWKEFPVLWQEVVLVAAGVSLCDQIFIWLFSLNEFGRIAADVQADQLVAGAVLLALIMNFTEAKSLPTAAGIMLVSISANTALQFAQTFFF